MVAPMDFIPIAEETGLIVPITEWVLRRACIEARDWDDISVAINLSPAVFKHQDLLGLIAAVLRDTDFDPLRLELEITETILLQDTERALTILGDLKAMGIRIAMDDFGTGYSSLQYLHSLPIDVLKIDRTFVANAIKSDESLAILRAIQQLATSVNKLVVAEGVEDDETIEALKKLDIDMMQGYGIMMPTRLDEWTLEHRTRLPATMNTPEPTATDVKSNRVANA